jgi:hypothetical protein
MELGQVIRDRQLSELVFQLPLLGKKSTLSKDPP